MPTGVFAATDWGIKGGEQSRRTRIFGNRVPILLCVPPITVRRSTGLGTNYGLTSNPNPAPEAVPWDVSTGLVMLGQSLTFLSLRPIGVGGFPGYEEGNTFQFRNHEGHTPNIRVSPVGHHRDHRRSALLASGGVGSVGRALGSYTVRRLTSEDYDSERRRNQLRERKMEPSKSIRPQFQVVPPEGDTPPEDWTPRRARKWICSLPIWCGQR